jgi:hypothetical protein
MAVENRNTASSDSIGQCFVEIGAGDLVSVFESGSGLVGEVEVAGLISAKENCAVLLHKPLLLDRVEKAGLFQESHAAGQHAFADYKAGKNLFFDDEQAKTFTLQLGGREGTGRSCSDDEDIVICCAWVAHQR